MTLRDTDGRVIVEGETLKSVDVWTSRTALFSSCGDSTVM
jgi:hypothetical protein